MKARWCLGKFLFHFHVIDLFSCLDVLFKFLRPSPLQLKHGLYFNKNRRMGRHYILKQLRHYQEYGVSSLSNLMHMPQRNSGTAATHFRSLESQDRSTSLPEKPLHFSPHCFSLSYHDITASFHGQNANDNGKNKPNNAKPLKREERELNVMNEPINVNKKTYYTG